MKNGSRAGSADRRFHAGRDPVTHDNHTRAVLAILLSALSLGVTLIVVAERYYG